jgi:hypothetical protein
MKRIEANNDGGELDRNRKIFRSLVWFLEAQVKVLITGGAGFTLLPYKASNESWVETAKYSVVLFGSWRHK